MTRRLTGAALKGPQRSTIRGCSLAWGEYLWWDRRYEQ